MTTDDNILHRISGLVAEEKDLRDRREAGTISDDKEHQRIAELEAQLDQAWDLLRRRKAKEQYGENPDTVTERPVSEVEDYLG